MSIDEVDADVLPGPEPVRVAGDHGAVDGTPALSQGSAPGVVELLDDDRRDPVFSGEDDVVVFELLGQAPL